MPQFLLFLFLVFATPTYKTIAIADGDTLAILQNNKPVKIRLEGIDAPEKGMPFGKASKQYLSDLCFCKYVSVRVVTTDRYGRSVARVILPDGKDASVEMIKAGYAWHYKKYSSDKILSKLEIAARKKRIGLWQDKKPMAPWEIRKLHRKGISTKGYFNLTR